MKEPNVKKVLVEVTIANGLEIEARQTSKLWSSTRNSITADACSDKLCNVVIPRTSTSVYKYSDILIDF